jgi:60S ribosome subunit biogenesis protein NIP7
MKAACHISKKELVSFGTCIGKFTHSGKFRLHVTALPILSPFAKNKIWLKPSAEQQFLYGNHVLKAGLGRITESTEKNQGVLVYSMSDIPLGFGVTAKSTSDCRRADPSAMVCLHQADVGEYLRDEQGII